MEDISYVGNVPIPDSNEVVQVTRKKKVSEPLPPYNIVGNGFSSRHGTSVDMIDICAQLNVSEIKLLQFLRDEYTFNCMNKEDIPNKVIPTRSCNFTDYLKMALRKNYSHLEYVGIIRRIKRGIYLINPDLLIPSRGYLEVKSMWLSLSRSNDGN